MSSAFDFSEQLARTSITMERFRELAARLLAYGVLVRDEDRTEQVMYDEARQVEDLLADYFSVVGMHLHHNANAQFFRLYAPGAVADGIADDAPVSAPSLKARVSVDFVAAAIALRFLYQEKLSQGLIDAQGEALISFEDLALTLQTQLKRQLPERDTERMALLAELKRHRILRYASTFSIRDADAYLAIRPLILGVVSDSALAEAIEAFDSTQGAAEVKALEDETMEHA